MAFSATGIGFSAYVEFGKGNQVFRPQTPPSQPQNILQPKYHDSYTGTSEKKDYSFGTSPNALRSYTTDGRGSPNRSTKL